MEQGARLGLVDMGLEQVVLCLAVLVAMDAVALEVPGKDLVVSEPGPGGYGPGGFGPGGAGTGPGGYGPGGAGTGAGSYGPGGSGGITGVYTAGGQGLGSRKPPKSGIITVYFNIDNIL